MNRTINASEIWEAVGSCVEVSYKLIRVNALGGVYLLCISSIDESVAIVAGYEEKEALALAELMAKGDVTPCTANNIYADMLNK